MYYIVYVNKLKKWGIILRLSYGYAMVIIWNRIENGLILRRHWLDGVGCFVIYEARDPARSLLLKTIFLRISLIYHH